jgi:hypothetical protein
MPSGTTRDAGACGGLQPQRQVVDGGRTHQPPHFLIDLA